MRYINDDKYFPRDATLKTQRLHKVSENNIQILQSESPSYNKIFSSFVSQSSSAR